MAGIWYATTAVHLWRFYFRYANANPDKMTVPNRENWKACDRTLKRFSDQEKDIIRHYYMTGFGNYEDMSAVRELSNQTGKTGTEVWELIKSANYNVIVERGLMDRIEKKPVA